MPVRIGFPTGVKGITQLVHGPQYATGVGLVKYGAQAMADAPRARRRPRARAAAAASVDQAVAPRGRARQVAVLGVDQAAF